MARPIIFNNKFAHHVNNELYYDPDSNKNITLATDVMLGVMMISSEIIKEPIHP